MGSGASGGAVDMFEAYGVGQHSFLGRGEEEGATSLDIPWVRSELPQVMH